MTMTEPSTTCLRASLSSTEAPEDTQRQVPVVHPEAPNLHYLPLGVYATYRRLPLLPHVFVLLFSIWTSALTTWKRLTWQGVSNNFRGLEALPPVREFMLFLTRMLVWTLLAKSVLQDIFLSPSRLSTKTLRERLFLPSPLSHYEQVSIPSRNGTRDAVGIHFLKYHSTSPCPSRYDALYFHHGFGASSLSWLPALPVLVNRLRVKLGLGHDRMGFGFTDRRDELEWYTMNATAAVSKSLLSQHTAPVPPKSLLLIGHSMGALSVLKLALELPPETRKFVVLVAPAFGLSRPPAASRQVSRVEAAIRSTLVDPLRSTLRERVLYPMGSYALRRLVGAPKFWRRGLTVAWGNPRKLQDSDVLRFQWPSIGKGWERGLLNFCRARDVVDDKELLRQVLEQPNTTVAVVVGGRDRIVPNKHVRKVMDEFTSYGIPMIELDALGHDPFEEDVESFVAALESLEEFNT